MCTEVVSVINESDLHMGGTCFESLPIFCRFVDRISAEVSCLPASNLYRYFGYSWFESKPRFLKYLVVISIDTLEVSGSNLYQCYQKCPVQRFHEHGNESSAFIKRGIS